jgi:hypothetical protein
MLHAIADHVRERNESVIMTLSNGIGYKIPRRAKATLIIVDGP